MFLAPLSPEEESEWLLLVLPSSGPSRRCKSELRSWSIGSSGPAHLVCSHGHKQITSPTVAFLYVNRDSPTQQIAHSPDSITSITTGQVT